jgi:hypothetical protein
MLLDVPITVVARSKGLTVFAHTNTGILGSNMDVCIFSVCVFLCLDSGLATG